MTKRKLLLNNPRNKTVTPDKLDEYITKVNEIFANWGDTGSMYLDCSIEESERPDCRINKNNPLQIKTDCNLVDEVWFSLLEDIAWQDGTLLYTPPTCKNNDTVENRLGFDRTVKTLSRKYIVAVGADAEHIEEEFEFWHEESAMNKLIAIKDDYHYAVLSEWDTPYWKSIDGELHYA